MKKIICFHLYNDFSGSPKILSLVIEGLIRKGYKVELYTSSTNGFLSDIPGVVYHVYNYRWSKNKIKTSLLLLKAQLYLFFSALTYWNKKEQSIFYINTICPIGAVLSARICRIPTIYHIHEKYVHPNLLHRVYEQVWKRCSTKTIFVSHYLQTQYDKKQMDTVVVYNALSPDFVKNIRTRDHDLPLRKILMICSLKAYKGVVVFCRLAEILPQYEFTLVLNSTDQEIKRSFPNIPPNLHIYPIQTNVHPFYEETDLVLNLSIPGEWVETFGLTLLEAMAYGLPVIAPPVGGPVELVENGSNGYLVDSREIQDVKEKIIFIFESGQYARFSKNAHIKSSGFCYDDMIRKIEVQIIEI